MKPVEFKESNATLAKDQPEYLPLPVHIDGTTYGVVTSCWKMSLRERLKVLLTGKVWLKQMTFLQRLQPQLISVDKPEEIAE